MYRANHLLQRMGLELLATEAAWPLRFGIDPVGVELLADPSFQASIKECRAYSVLDTARLANLWMLCRVSNPNGGVIEVGSFRGGTALHLSNAVPDRSITVCDTFAGFASYDPALDSNFQRDAFRDTNVATVDRLFSQKGRPYRIIAGEFPASVGDKSLAPISFAHVDVDVYAATLSTLRYLSGLMIERSLIVLDDRHRKASGVDTAVEEFLAEDRRWIELPVFPAQGLLIDRRWLGSEDATQHVASR